MALKRIIYTDEEGRKKVVLLPEESPEEDAARGIPVGPPMLTDLNLPPEIEVRLSNELFHRSILEPKDALKRRNEIMYALQSALKVSVDSIVALYVGRDFNYARTESPENQSDAIVHNRRSRKPRK